MEQLDEHLSELPQQSPPGFIQVGITIFIYFILLILSFVIYYTLFESLGLNKILPNTNTTLGIITQDLAFSFLLQSLVVLSNYYLQGRLYDLFNQSLQKTILIPVLLWIGIIGASFLQNSLHDPTSIVSPIEVFLRLSTVLTWYSTLCVIIALYFERKNRTQYYGMLFIHWLFFVLTIYFVY